jgi:hypothetical protein
MDNDFIFHLSLSDLYAFCFFLFLFLGEEGHWDFEFRVAA